MKIFTYNDLIILWFLVYAVLLHIKRKHSLAEFFRIINGMPLAMKLLECYAKQHDMQLLKDFYYQDDRSRERANIALSECYEQSV
jgi:vacuolar protein sorting-associated protein 16